VINPSTPVHIVRDIAEYIDQLLIMTVNPGYGGQKFISNSIRRIKEAVELRKNISGKFLIQIDGGVNPITAKQAFEAGAEIFVTGSSIFKEDNISAAAMEIKNLIT
ncbi:MAG: ribulose-phosphate 3-epimerase, partial [Ignavibacteriaceae bacterium]